MLRRSGVWLADRVRQWLPDSFVFALGLTGAAGLLALFATPSGPFDVLEAWYRGFWILLEFGMQIVLVLVTGYAIALSPPARAAIDRLAARMHTPAQVYLSVMVVGGLLSLVSWSWVVLVAVLARELAERVEGLDYPYLTACVFLSSWSWVGGLSSSIPLVLNTEGNFLIETGAMSSTLPIGRTLGSPMNLVHLAALGTLYTVLMVVLRPRRAAAVPFTALADPDGEPGETVAEEAEATRLASPALSDRLNHSRLLQGAVVLAGLVWSIRYFATRGFDLNLEIMIFLFLLLGLAVHGSPMRYVVAMRRACRNISGIVFQYPFYAGIMGLMMFTGLGARIAEWMSLNATATTLPALGQLTGALVNFAIPSAGGEWAVLGPSFVEAAQKLGAELGPEGGSALVGRVAMAVAYGETSTNLLQPFFLLVILPVMGAGARLQARDVVGHLVLPFGLGYLLTAAVVSFFPL